MGAGLSDLVKERFAEMRAKREQFTATTELREVLPQLYTDEARATLIETLAYKYNIPSEYVQQAVNHYIATDNGKAQWLTYLETNNEKEFVQVGKQLGWKIRKEFDEQDAKRDAIQGRVAKPTRNLSSEEYELAKKEIDVTQLETDEALYIIDLWEQINRIEEAANGALQIGVPILAIDIYERHGMYLEDAAKRAEQAGMLERAINDYEASSKYEKAGEIAENLATQKRTERQKTRGIQSMLYEALADSYTPEEKKLIERAITNYEKAGWTEQAVSLAERINDPERVVSIYENAGKAEDAAEYALKKGMTKKFLEICEKEGHYEVAEGIAKETQQKDRALLYEKIDAIIKYGHNMDLYKERKQFFLDLESMTAESSNNDKESDAKGERRSKRTEQERGEQDVLNYCRRRISELRDCILVEGTFEAIKMACGVDTTAQLVKKAATVVLTVTGLSSPYAVYQMYNTSQQPETSQVAYEAPKPKYVQTQEVSPTTQTAQYETKEVKTMRKGCGQ